MTKRQPRSLELCAIGLGQAGGNLAAEWHRRGYPALLFNTARSDFKALAHHEGLALPDELQVHIGLADKDGAGRDPEYGAACIETHRDRIRTALEARLEGVDAFLVCAGLGGGTGSAVPALLEIIASLDKPALAVVTIPAHAESGITKVNAVRAANAVVNAPLHGRIFIDNARLVESFPDVDIVSYFPHVNTRVLAPLDEMNRLNLRDDVWSIRSFDAEDMRKVLLSGGVLQTHVERLDAKGPLTVASLVDVVARCVDGGRHLASGLDLADSAYLALVVTGPEAVLKQTPMSVFDAATADLKKRTKGGAVYDGVYITEGSEQPMAYVLSASLALPARVEELLAEAQQEGGDLMRKIQAEIPALEVSPLEGLNLFRGPSAPKGTPPRRPEVKPRPIKAQLDAGASAGPAKPSAPAPVEPAPQASRTRAASVETPRVGTGRVDEDVSQIEPTMMADKSAAPKAPKPTPPPAEVPERARAQAAEPAPSPERPSMVQVGTGRYDENGGAALASELTSDIAMSDVEDLDALAQLTIPSEVEELDSFIDEKTEAVAKEALRAADVADGFEPDDENTHMLDDLKHRGVPPPIGADEAPERSHTVPTIRFEEVDNLLSSVLMMSAQDSESLQRVYEDLIDRFRQAPDRRGRERVARRLIEDARSEDVEVRALSVWAMVKLRERGFRRALSRASEDKNPEIKRLAASGIEALEGG